VIYTGLDNALSIRQISQDRPGGKWVDGGAFGGEAKRMSIVQKTDGRWQLFHAGLDGNMYDAYQTSDSQWSSHVRLAMAEDVAADGTLVMIYRRGSELLQGWWEGKAWKLDQPFGGEATAMTMARRADGTLLLVHARVNQSLGQRQQETPGGRWKAFEDFPVPGSATDLTMWRGANGRLTLLHVGTDDCIYQSSQGADLKWSEHKPLGGMERNSHSVYKARNITAVMNADQRPDVFFVGKDSRIYHTHQQVDSSWSVPYAVDGRPGF
jgi:hypothetical protein